MQSVTQVSHKTNGTRALLKSLTVAQLLKKYPAFRETELLLPFSQEPIYGHYPELLNPSLRLHVISCNMLPFELVG
jgi:hypothetical protein